MHGDGKGEEEDGTGGKMIGRLKRGRMKGERGRMEDMKKRKNNNKMNKSKKNNNDNLPTSTLSEEPSNQQKTILK